MESMYFAAFGAQIHTQEHANTQRLVTILKSIVCCIPNIFSLPSTSFSIHGRELSSASLLNWTILINAERSTFPAFVLKHHKPNQSKLKTYFCLIKCLSNVFNCFFFFVAFFFFKSLPFSLSPSL